ncbi:hypothetical protein VKS41_005763 [Umbelopsis sp. WA50703]
MSRLQAAKWITILALASQVRDTLQQDEPSDSHAGHSHDLDPAIFASSAATDEPIGSIMTLHLTTMILKETGQCLAHFIMGSSFVGYGIIMLLSLRVGGPWLLKRKRSQEWYDSWTITAWGIVNTFTEHRWGSNWNATDFQHTSMGIIWVAAGMVGIWTSRSEQRSVVPAIVIALTAAAFQGHAQHVANSGHIHSFFGYMLMAGALSRIIEICFVWKKGVFKISPWQYMPPMFLMMAGVMFMGATEEQLALLADKGIDPSSYINILLSFAFFMFFYVNVLLSMWERLSGYNNDHSTEGYTEVENVELHDNADFLEDEEEDNFTKEQNGLPLGSISHDNR